MTGPATPPPPPGPGRDVDEPLDPQSVQGREVAERLTRTLAAIELELAQSESAQAGRAA